MLPITGSSESTSYKFTQATAFMHVKEFVDSLPAHVCSSIQVAFSKVLSIIVMNDRVSKAEYIVSLIILSSPQGSFFLHYGGS